jgi:hypothetical protein
MMEELKVDVKRKAEEYHHLPANSIDSASAVFMIFPLYVFNDRNSYTSV